MWESEIGNSFLNSRTQCDIYFFNTGVDTKLLKQHIKIYVF